MLVKSDSFILVMLVPSCVKYVLFLHPSSDVHRMIIIDLRGKRIHSDMDAHMLVWKIKSSLQHLSAKFHVNNFSLAHGKLAEITSWVHVLHGSRFTALVF